VNAQFHNFSMPYGMLMVALALPAAYGNQQLCSSGISAPASVLVQMHSKDTFSLSRSMHLDAHNQAERHRLVDSHLRSRAGSGRNDSDSGGKDAGIKIANEQMEFVQDGIVAVQTVDRDLVNRSIKEVSDMQIFIMRLVAALLFGNIVAVGACMCQMYSQKNTNAPSNKIDLDALPPNLAVAAQLLLGQTGAESLQRAPSPQLPIPLQPEVDTTSASPQPCDPASEGPISERSVSTSPIGASRVVATSPKASTRPVQQKTELRRLEKDALEDASLGRWSPGRTVDAFCTPGTPRLRLPSAQ